MVRVRAKYWCGRTLLGAALCVPFSSLAQTQPADTPASPPMSEPVPAELPPDTSEAPPEESDGTVEVDTDEAPVEMPVIRKKAGRVYRDKTVQGTMAHDRFEPETVNKSKYKRNGQPLDVDPD